MPISHSNSFSTSEKSYLFIDGAYLRNRLQEYSSKFFAENPVEIDLKQLLGRVQNCQKCFYYDCKPFQGKKEHDDDYQDRLSKYEGLRAKVMSTPGYHFIEGVTRNLGQRPKQKAVDTMLSVDMLRHAYNGNMQKCTLIAGDLDFLPAVKALVDAGIYVTIWYSDRSIAEELLHEADDQKFLDLNTILGISTGDFKGKYEKPGIDSKEGRHVQDFVKLAHGKTIEGDEIEIYKNEAGKHLLIFPTKPNSSQLYHFSHMDRAFLEAYTRSQYKMTWQWE